MLTVLDLVGQVRREYRYDVRYRAILGGTRHQVQRAVGRLLHVDDHDRLGAWRALLATEHPPAIADLFPRDYRLALMLFAILGGRRQPIAEADRVLARIRGTPMLRREVVDLLEILSDRIRTVSRPLDPVGKIPLSSHATYTLGEIVAAHARTDKRGALVSPQGGVLWDATAQTDLLFVTLEKSDADYSPTTRYADYPIAPTLFHWESQNNASPDTPAGRRYCEQPDRGTHVVLFVRERKKDARGETLPYHCLGRVQYRSHESERPMKILWELERRMPGWLYQAGKVVAG